MCTTYYATKSCMAEAEFKPAHKKLGQSKLDQVYSALNQSYAKIYTSINEKFSPKKEDGKIEADDLLDTSSDSLTPVYDLEDLEIGPYYLYREENERREQLSGKEARHLWKKERKWERIMTQTSGKPIEEVHKHAEFYSEEDLCLKQYAVLHPKTFPQLLQEGPPMEYRWSVWKLLLRPHRFYVEGLYEKLRDLTSPYEVQINKDLHRTFPEEKYFSSKNFDKIGQEQLGNVLRAISLYFTNTGYVQGMNFLAGLLLLISGGDELQTFWMLVALARDPRFLFMGLFEKDFPLLNFYVSIFHQALEEISPSLYHHIQKHQLPIDMWLLKWFLTVFIPTFPSKDVVRLWDFILRQGFFGMIKVAIGILKFYEKELMHQDACGMNLMFQSMMEEHLQKEYQENINILNSLNPLINMLFRRNKDTTSNKPAHVRCSFREFDVEQVLELASEIPLGFEDIKGFIISYEEKSKERLPEPYRKILVNMANIHNGVRKFKELQTEIDYYIMRSGLHESEKSWFGSLLEEQVQPDKETAGNTSA